ncbi:hypothetical protein ACTHSJ_33745 [Paenibacillus cellulositrophicus]|uniref:hypothetical protein n=1 Tax=Paenibacillus cellulositrophicus TaxID=562959 RepID=UPI003F80CF52
MWDFGEFRILCERRNRQVSTMYPETLKYKETKARHYSEMSINHWQTYIQQYGLDPEDSGLDQLEFEAEADMESALQAVHSMPDVIAQIVNLTIDLGMNVGHVSIKSVRRVLNNQFPQLHNMLTRIDALLSSNEFKYVEGFVNTTKHRRLINITAQGYFGAGTQNRYGLKYESFEYNGDVFPEMWFSEVSNDIIPNVIDMICDIGNELNSILR